ncbi:MAG TPA: mechanosensitive ion channel domain-containing protein [Acidobacteriaceae bacterium]|nr:mechanosensitive ion channel domain-containing protein [Acidobacteriaceae bacterium]
MTGPLVQFTGPNRTLTLGGVKLLGLNAHAGHKLLFTLVLFAFLYALSRILRFLARKLGGDRQKTAFWTRQGISLTTFLLAIIGFCSIWFDNPARLTTGVGLVSAGVAFALQKVITSFAGYFVILRGKTFNVGDRIKMGSVRGDVISLNFIQTVIMEMGEPPPCRKKIRACGFTPASTPAASSPSPTPPSLTSPSITTPATSPTSGRRCTFPSSTATATAPSPSSSTPSIAIPRTSPTSPLQSSTESSSASS